LQISASTHPAVPASPPCTYLAVLGQFPMLYCQYSYLLQRQLSNCCACSSFICAFSSGTAAGITSSLHLAARSLPLPRAGFAAAPGLRQHRTMLSSDFKGDRGEGTFFSIIIIIFFLNTLWCRTEIAASFYFQRPCSENVFIWRYNDCRPVACSSHAGAARPHECVLYELLSQVFGGHVITDE